MPVKAYIYAEDGALLGYLAYINKPPEVLDFNGRYFEHRGTSQEYRDEDVVSYDYWEIDIEHHLDVIYICIGCGRNASLVWWKCCHEHVDIDSPDVYCQSCVEKLHPGDPEFARD